MPLIARRIGKHLAGIEDKSYNSLRVQHVADYQGLFRRVSLELGRTAAATRPGVVAVRLVILAGLATIAVYKIL